MRKWIAVWRANTRIGRKTALPPSERARTTDAMARRARRR
jgi:hypothetical protein